MIPTRTPNPDPELESHLVQARLLISRLERLSADSLWARRASGYRASLLKAIDYLEQIRLNPDSKPNQTQELQSFFQLIERGYLILDLAARELIKGRRSSR